jgi:uncharacterized protein (DUF3084 family)
MRRSGNPDEAPPFLTELLNGLREIREQQEEMAGMLTQVGEGQALCRKRLDALEARVQVLKEEEDALESTVQGLKDEEERIANELLTAQGRREGIQSLLNRLTAPALLLATWFLSQIWFSIQHAQRDEADRQQRLREQAPQRGQPNPPPQKKP